MPWDAGAAMDRLQRTRQSIEEMKQRKKESNRAMLLDLLGKGVDVGKTWYNAKQAKELELARQSGMENLEYLRQGGEGLSDARAATAAEKAAGVASGRLTQEYGLRSGEGAESTEKLFPLWDKLFPGLTREQQLAKWSYWQGMSRPSDSAKDPQAESQWTSAADVAARNAIQARFADIEKWPTQAAFWNAVAADPILAGQVIPIYRSEAEKYLRDYIKDSATRTMAVDALEKDFMVFLNATKSEDQPEATTATLETNPRETSFQPEIDAVVAKAKELVSAGYGQDSKTNLDVLSVIQADVAEPGVSKYLTDQAGRLTYEKFKKLVEDAYQAYIRSKPTSVDPSLEEQKILGL